MKKFNKNIKKITIINILIIVIFALIFTVYTNVEQNSYKKILNQKTSEIINKVLEKYPKISEEEIISVLEEKSKSKADILSKYGYEDDYVYVKQIETSMKQNIKLKFLLILLLGIIMYLTYVIYIAKQEKKIEEINTYLKEINKRNYTLKIEDNAEDEISKLRNELYKTTILLKESADNSEKEKKQLSNSLADISHQLKTPLTSITIMLDNINENPNMDEKTKTEFIKEITKQTEWINSLVISLLKLAKFDAGAIKMNNKEINVKQLIENIKSNLSILLEIKEIQIIEKISENITFIGDFKWQLEALTNIVKNAIEHSKENSKIYIKTENTSLFLKIIIKDEGNGIKKEDIKHIFQRFYKSENSPESSIGIGLPLAKAIIEKNNGYIKVDSKENEGTTFEIKYLKT